MRLAAQPRESVALVVHDTLIFSDFCHPILVKIEGMLPGTKAVSYAQLMYSKNYPQAKKP
jgi:hypothetical protein